QARTARSDGASEPSGTWNRFDRCVIGVLSAQNPDNATVETAGPPGLTSHPAPRSRDLRARQGGPLPPPPGLDTAGPARADLSPRAPVSRRAAPPGFTAHPGVPASSPAGPPEPRQPQPTAHDRLTGTPTTSRDVTMGSSPHRQDRAASIV